MSIPRTLISFFIGLVSCGEMVASDSEIIVAHRSRSAQGGSISLRPGVEQYSGPGLPRGGTRLCPGLCAVPAGGGHPAALPGAVGVVVYASGAGAVAASARAGGGTPRRGPAAA